ncbi:uncharacterized protein LOC116135597 [Pistacia vera]|uniref:uncharacterized protein LOC116135597 n=1 Tax=Pistacia vera TaxID=55513 RepID=UPI0012632D08|nr:uncharacterized protein LOC116135597 [Pistacia vera]
MNNGEGTRENASEVASPDVFDSFPPKSDGGDVSPASLSHYSSCGESEFERYCSANSVMGTPSVRSLYGTSLNDGLDSEFGSLNSLGFGEDVNFENFILGGDRKVSTLGDHKIEFRKQRNDDKDEKIGSGFSGLRLYDDSYEGRNVDEDMALNSCGTVSGDNFALEGTVENVLIGGSCSNVRVGERSMNGVRDASDVEGGPSLCVDSEVKGSCQDGLHLQFCSEFDRREMELEEDGTSSRYEHSEGEDSMYNYGSDEEHKNISYYPRKMEYVKEAKCEKENPLLINSRVAFGSEDWDDFELEVGGSTMSSPMLDKFQEKREVNFESDRNLLDSVTSIAIPSDSQKEQINDTKDVPGVSGKIQGADDSEENINHTVMNPAWSSCHINQESLEKDKDIPAARYQVQGADVLAQNSKSSFSAPINLPRFSGLDEVVSSVVRNQVQRTENTKSSSPTSICLPRFSGVDHDVGGISIASNEVQDADDVTMYHNNGSVSNAFVREQDPVVEKAPLKMGLDTIDSRMEIINQYLSNKERSTNDSGSLESEEFGHLKAQFLPLAEIPIDQLCAPSIGSAKMSHSEPFEDCEPTLSPPTFGNILNPSKNAPASADLSDDHPALTKKENLELHDFYDEVVHEMEEILLDYNESPGARFSQGNQIFKSQVSLPLRDGSSTASPSGTDDAYPLTSLPLRIDGVEVVGAKQKKGDVSLSERLVGVKEYTVYKIRVWSGKDQWEVERRYRDFFTLYRRLKSFYADHGWILPSPWSSVEKESRKIFGNASPDVVAERSVLIQECLQSVIRSCSFSSPPGALIWFLSPQDSLPSSPVSNTPVSRSTSFTRGADAQNTSPLGKTISLIVEIRPQKSMKQMLEAQHYTCAGCHKHFFDGMTLIQDFVQTFGWGKPRLCEYTGQLFCSSCHNGDTAVLPARVLHHWDFTRYPISQLAKSYLDSVYDQPMLCVSAVNPFLYSKVPALQHVMGVRKKIGAMLPFVRCPFRRSINKGLGSRRYLLESNDFFALRDLIDLSKGPFAG